MSRRLFVLQAAFCLVQTAYQCALNRVLGLFLLQFLRISKLLYLFSGRESFRPAGGVKRGWEPRFPPPLNNLPPLLVQIPNKYLEKWIFIWYLQVTLCWLLLVRRRFQCSAAHQCRSLRPMLVLITVVHLAWRSLQPMLVLITVVQLLVCI